MRINKVTIENFRGIQQKTPFLLGEKFILLSAPNGTGKTTIIDAIEWALTGSIGRLLDAYAARSTNQAERSNLDNLSGILKNKNTLDSENACVELEFEVEQQIFVIKRTQSSDILNPAKSRLTVLLGDKTACLRFIKEITPNFYAHHFCDIQKSINIQSKKRESFVEMLDEFISDYHNEDTIAKNLLLFAKDTERYIMDIDFKLNQLQPQIARTQGILSHFQKESVVFHYPSTPIYQDEQTDIQKLSESEMHTQLQYLYDCGYTKALELITPLTLHDLHYKIVHQLSHLKGLIKDHKSQIDEAICLSELFGNMSQSISKCEDQINKYKNISLSHQNLDLYADELISLGSAEFSQDFYHQEQEKIIAIDNQINDLKNVIHALTQGNKILNALTTLLGTRSGLIAYKHEQNSKKGLAKCPVCGSEIFGSMEDSQILSEVDSYNNQNAQIVTKEKAHLHELQKSRDVILDELLHAAKIALENEISQKTAIFCKRKQLKKDTESFFTIVRSLQESESDFPLSRWADIDSVNELVRKHSTFLLHDEEILARKSGYEIILQHLNFPYEPDEPNSALLARISTARKNDIRWLSEFSVELLSSKINALKGQLKNEEYLECTRKLDLLSQQKADLEQQRLHYVPLIKLAEEQSKIISTTISQLKEKEYDSIGPYLLQLYRKLSRINSFKGLGISSSNGKVTIIDEKGKNIINVLSNGQLSVFVLSYFFAGLLVRKDTSPCKVYFIDDLTACMDDLNMLAFLDLMKYQISETQSEGGSIDQLFFASCDHHICQLIKYKLSGCHIQYREVREKDFKSTN